MILKFNYYFQLSILIIYAISNLVAFDSVFFMFSLLLLGILHMASFVLLMLQPLSRTGKVFRNWIIYLLGVFQVPLWAYATTIMVPEAWIYLFGATCLTLALFFVYNSFQLWKTWHDDNV